MQGGQWMMIISACAMLYVLCRMIYSLRSINKQVDELRMRNNSAELNIAMRKSIEESTPTSPNHRGNSNQKFLPEQMPRSNEDV